MDYDHDQELDGYEMLMAIGKDYPLHEAIEHVDDFIHEGDFNGK